MTEQGRHEALRLLLIESDLLLARMVSEQLAKSVAPRIDLERAPSLEEASHKKGRFDAILTGLWLSDAFGFEILDRLSEIRRCPIVVIGSGSDRWLAVQALRHGAQDCLFKDELDERTIVRAVLFAAERHRREIRLREENERLAIANQRLERLAETDPLTLVLNRRGLERAMFNRRVPRGRPPCAMLVDCDDFKLINDVHGYAAGDDVLREIAQRLGRCLREADTISRVGGDEFLILLADTSEEEGVLIADRARSAVSKEPIATVAGQVSITVSISVCAVPAPGGSLEEALLQLHLGLLESKQTGKDCVSVSTDLPRVTGEKFAVSAK